MGRDWRAWHEAYDGDTPLRERLAIVRGQIRRAIDDAPPGPVQVISVCAGDGRDVLGVLADHPRARDVRGRLVELDRELAARAAAAAPPGIDVVCGDASSTCAYAGAVPADIVLVCGVFGNITDRDIQRTIHTLPMLCNANAAVIWTRHRRPPDRTRYVRSLFADAGFDEVMFEAPDTFLFGVGTHRLTVPPARFRPETEMFTFVGYDHLDPA